MFVETGFSSPPLSSEEEYSWYHPLEQKTVKLAPSPMVIFPSFALFGKTVFEKVANTINETKVIIQQQSRCVLSLFNPTARAITMTLRVFTPVSLSEEEYNGLLDAQDPRVQPMAMTVDQAVTDDGWGIATIETMMQSNDLVRITTRRLRLVAGETLTIPLQRLTIFDPLSIFHFGFLLVFGQESRLESIQIFRIGFYEGFESFFDPTNDAKMIMAPFLVTLEVDGELPQAWLSYENIFTGK